MHVRSGQSLVEILVAVAVGTIMILGAIVIVSPALRLGVSGTASQAAVAGGRDLIENVRAFSEGSWSGLYSLSKGASTTYYFAAGASPFVAVTGTESFLSDGLTSGLAGYWKLDESTGTTVFDSSGNTSSGSILAGVVASTSCKFGGCLSFDGATGTVTIANTSSLNVTSTLSISAWIYPTKNSGTQDVLSKSSNSQNTGYIFPRTEDGWSTIIFYVYSGGWKTLSATYGSAKLNQWHHTAATYDGATMNIYLDGALIGTKSQTGSIATNTNSLAFGNQPGFSEYFGGSMDDIRIYNKALSASDILSIYRAPAFTRSFYISNVNRDGSGYITTGSGTDDPSTQKVTVTYAGSTGASKTFTTYLTRSRNNPFWQTDWSGGPGQTGPVTSTNSQFSTSTGMDVTTTTGSIRIKGI